MDHYKESINAFDKLAQGYQNKFMDLDLYNDSYDRLIQHIGNPEAKILDAGCGPGNISKYLLNKYSSYQMLGIDMSPNMIELARKNNPEAEYKVWDCMQIDQLNEKFDAIICGFCMPYLSAEECGTLIKISASSLNSNGIIYCSTIEGDPAGSGWEMSSTGEAKAYVYYHEEKFLSASLLTNSFQILETIRIPYEKGEGNVQVHLVMISKLL